MWSILYLLRNDPEKLKWSQRRRGLDESVVDEALRLDLEWRRKLGELNDLRHRHNVISREIARLRGVERDEKIREAKRLQEEVTKLEAEVEEVKRRRDKL
ncbi:MAG TPA: serine--tRNA ligase, partial [Candidatus Bathyarchaeota archaeon]|nr:serine--tRNA ligase [Candidatus Bathyarchaeota archaeon]